MSAFFEAFEQAERERALREEAGREPRDAGPAPGVSLAPEPASAPPRDVLSKSPAAFPDGAADARDEVEGHLVSLLYPVSHLAEPYRALRHKVEQLHRSSQVSILAVSSAGVGDGKTTTAINLAGALAQAPDARVLLVDADLRNPAIARNLALFEASGGPGLVDAILDQGFGLDDVVSTQSSFNLDVLTAGTPSRTPYEILKSPRLGQLLEQARDRYDYVVLDSAPLVPVPDSRLIGKWVDGFVLVVAAHKTPRKMLGEALNHLDPARVLGLVFNQDDESLSRSYRRYGYGGDGIPVNGTRPKESRFPWRRLMPFGKRQRIRR